MIDTSSLCLQLCRPQPLCSQLARCVSVPMHCKLSSQIMPSPGPYRLPNDCPANLFSNQHKILYTEILLYTHTHTHARTHSLGRHGSIMRFSTVQHARHLESHHVPTTQLWIEILHRIWYLDGKLCVDDGMFKLTIRNKFNKAAATFCFQVYNSFTI